MLPSLSFEKTCVPIDALENAFKHGWQIDLLFSRPGPIPEVPFLYILSSSLWETNLKNLQGKIEDISFYQIRRPQLEVNDALHELRRELSSMRRAVTETLRYVPKQVEDFFEELREQNPNINMRLTPIELHAAFLLRADQLHNFFMETLQLFMNTIIIRDSQYSMAQAKESLERTRQSVLLTGLAALYLPLSLATSVFGMNLREMTGVGPQVWVFVVTVVTMSLVTVVAFRSEVFYKRLSGILQRPSRRPAEHPGL